MVDAYGDTVRSRSWPPISQQGKNLWKIPPDVVPLLVRHLFAKLSSCEVYNDDHGASDLEE